MQWLKNVSRGVRPLLSSCRLFIYLRARKRGLGHNPSGMALSHGGLGPVSRIRIEDGGHCLVQALVRPSSIHTPDTEGCQNKPCQTVRREEESMAQTMWSGNQQKTQRNFTCVIMHQTDAHVSILSVSQWHNSAVLFCPCGGMESRFRNNAAQCRWSNNNWQRDENRCFCAQIQNHLDL